jgi:glucose/arabinose dehydrogenase
MARRAWVAAVAVAVVLGCGSGPATGSLPATTTPSPAVGSVPPSGVGEGVAGFDFGAPEVVATGLAVPWGLDFLPTGAALVTERESGRVLRLVPGEAPEEVAIVEAAVTGGEGGLLGLAVSPTYADDRLIYVMYSTETESRIVRLRRGRDPEVVLGGIPGNPFHTGGRIAFGPDGLLYAAVGDATVAANAQDPASLAGKILRLEPDGSVPPDNPDPGSPVWSLGHRNVEGLAWDAAGRLWATEFGEAAWDEINRIEPGANYGWPDVEGEGGGARFVDPAVTWTTAEASPAGLAFAHGSLYAAALRGERLWRVPVEVDGGLGGPESLLEDEFGRLRTVELAPDGWLWLATSNRDGRGEPGPDDDRIVRFPPLEGGG